MKLCLKGLKIQEEDQNELVVTVIWQLHLSCLVLLMSTQAEAVVSS